MDQYNLDFDVVVLGSGPGGLQAALHAARSKARVAVLGRLRKSSLYKAHIENYCCLDGTVPGVELLEQGKRQVEKFGALFFDQDVINIERDDSERFLISLESGERLSSWTVILAMGISRNRLNVPGEKEFLGKGVSYCVECDGNFFRDQEVVVVGGESAAASGAMSLLLIAREVHLIYDELLINEHLAYHVERSAIIKHPGRRVKAIHGSRGVVEAVELDDGERIKASGVFIELGAKGALELASRLGVNLDPETMKYVAANKKQETNIPGIYAAGDLCGPPWQMAKAIGEGCVAGLEAVTFARKKRAKVSA
jgi:thioredoxin reductase (NADPH)